MKLCFYKKYMEMRAGVTIFVARCTIIDRTPPPGNHLDIGALRLPTLR